MIITKINPEYAWRMLGVGALMLAVALWALFDGIIAWPGINQQMSELRPGLLASNLTANAWLVKDEGSGELQITRYFAAYQQKAPRKLIKEMGFLRSDPKDSAPDPDLQLRRTKELIENPLYSPREIRSQFIMSIITASLSLLVLGTLFSKRSRVFMADKEHLQGSGFGEHPIPYSEIKSIDLKKWAEHGIGVLSLHNGHHIKLDGWHYANLTAIIDVIKEQRPDLFKNKP